MYDNYIENRAMHLMNGNPKIIDLVMTDKVAPIETLIKAPAEIYDAYRGYLEREGYNFIEDGSPFDILGVAHANAHRDALNTILAEEDAILMKLAQKKFPEKDTDGTEIVYFNRSEMIENYIRKQNEIGRTYGVEMTNAFFAQVKAVSDIKIGTTDRNAGFVAFKEEYDAKYKELSEIAQVVATYVFLEQYSKQIETGKAGLPPVNKSSKEYQAINERVMKVYFKQYNKSLASRKSDLLQERKGYAPDKTINEIVERICRY